MDFYESQDVARRKTGYLVFLFACATVAIVGSVYAVVTGALSSSNREIGLWNPELLVAVIGVTLAVIGLGSLYKIAQLRGGGSVVAAALGGRQVPPDSTDPLERKVLNVVEEMAVASGSSVPTVYMMNDEESINAFAAGYTTNDAVIGVTRGCVERLTRAELQGVIAHEFSHIFNGDMRLNIRLIGILHGILVIGMIGYFVLRTMFYTGGGRGRRGKDGGSTVPVMAIAFGLIVIGFFGTFFGNLIKSAVSRQREYLADASAVQFTRNPQAVAGALKKIGALGATVRNPAAIEISHMFFAQAITSGLSSMFRTHPPLADRIRRVDPSWDGVYPTIAERPTVEAVKPKASPGIDVGELVTGAAILAGATRAGTPDAGGAASASAIAQTGRPTPEHVEYAAELLRGLPLEVSRAAREPYGARAVIYSLLLNREPEPRRLQIGRVAERADAGIAKIMADLAGPIETLDERARLPLIDLATPALRELSPDQFERFRDNVTALIAADARLDLFEWVLQRTILHHLESHFGGGRATRVRYHKLGGLEGPCSVLLSALAHAGHEDRNVITAAFEAGQAALQLSGLRLLERQACEPAELDGALDVLERVTFRLKRRLLEAGAAAVVSDRRITVHEAELLRGIADALDCPVPPLLPGQPLA